MALTTVQTGMLGSDAQMLSFRNKIINGNMNIWQRGTTFAAQPAGVYSADRWYTNVSGTGVFTVSQQTDVPSDNQFLYSLRVAVTTADTSILTTDNAFVEQKIEGYNARSLIGNTFTLSFRVRSSKTGVHCIAFRSVGTASSDRSYVVEYTVNAANTWETKTVTVVGGLDISAGTWDWTNGTGLRISFALACGSTYQTTAGTWQSGNYIATANQVNCLDTIGNIFAITGVQLEVGSAATPFEQRPYGLELSLCQRYCLANTVFGTNAYAGAAGYNIGGRVQFPVQMRAAPTIATNTYSNGNAGTTTVDFVSASGMRYYAAASAAGGVDVGYSGIISAEL